MPSQHTAQETIPHWKCKHHCQDASATERANRLTAQARAVSGGRTAADGAGQDLASTSNPPSRKGGRGVGGGRPALVGGWRA